MENRELLEHSSPIRRIDVISELIDEVISGKEDEGLFSALMILGVDAILSDDIDSLHILEEKCHRSLSPSFGLSEVIKARMITFLGMAKSAGMRHIPPLTNAEITYLQLADGRPYKKEEGSEFTPEERKLMQMGCMVNRVYWMGLTARGCEALNRSRTQIEQPASSYKHTS